MAALVCCACTKPIAQISKPMLVGTYETHASSPREAQLELRLNADDTLLVTCRDGGEQTRGTWRVYEPYIVLLEVAREAIHGECAKFLPLSTSVTDDDGVLAISINPDSGIAAIKRSAAR